MCMCFREAQKILVNSEEKVAQSCPTLWDPMEYTVHEILQASILEWVAFPFSRIFPAQGSNPGLPHCRWILYQLSQKGSPRIPEWLTVRHPVTPRWYSNSRKQYGSVALRAQLVKNPPSAQETWVRFLGWEDPLERGKATHSSILA